MAGSATISVEIELGWGFHDRADPTDVPELSSDGARERTALDWFLQVCDEAGVPVSFDIVGHLLLESCDGTHDGPHEAGWFERDPGTDADRDPLYYFPEVTDRIAAADVDHEICTHTFSHVLCDRVSDEVLRWELQRSRELHEQDFSSLVPPRHRVPTMDVLRENDISVVRVVENEQIPSNPVLRYVWSYTRTHSLHRPEVIDGVVQTQTSPFMTLTASHLSRGVSAPHPSFRAVPRRLRQKSHERFLLSSMEAAVDEQSRVHYWTHLYNLAHEAQKRPVRRLITNLGERDSISVERMDELANP
jgi:hypothetical protein